jgi:hypothetical protein
LRQKVETMCKTEFSLSFLILGSTCNVFFYFCFDSLLLPAPS